MEAAHNSFSVHAEQLKLWWINIVTNVNTLPTFTLGILIFMMAWRRTLELFFFSNLTCMYVVQLVFIVIGRQRQLKPGRCDFFKKGRISSILHYLQFWPFHHELEIRFSVGTCFPFLMLLFLHFFFLCCLHFECMLNQIFCCTFWLP